MTKRQPPDSVRVRDVIENSLRRASAARRTGRSASAAAAARVVAAAAGRPDDLSYIAYLTALSEVTSRSHAEQCRGVRRMADLLGRPQSHDQAREALTDFIESSAAPGRVSREAVALACEAVGRPLMPAAPAPRRATAPSATADGAVPAAGDGERPLAGPIGREPGSLLGAVAGGVVAALAALAVAVLLNVVVDRVWLPAVETGRADTGLAGAAALVSVVVFGLRAGGVFVGRVGGAALRQRLQDDDQRRLVDRYAEAPVDWHRGHRPDDLVATAGKTIEQKWRLAEPLPVAIGGTCTLVVAVGGLAWLDPWLAVVGLAVLAGLALLSVAFLQIAGPQADRARVLRRRVFQLVDGATEPGADAGAVRPDPVAEFKAASAELRDVMIRLRRVRGMFVPVFGALPLLGMLFAVWTAGWGLRGTDGVADLVSAVFLGTVLTSPVLAIGSVLAELPAGRRGQDRIRRVCAEPGATGRDVAAGALATRMAAAAMTTTRTDHELDRVADASRLVCAAVESAPSSQRLLARASRSAAARDRPDGSATEAAAVAGSGRAAR